MATRPVAIETRGLREMRRDLRRLEPEIDKQLRTELRAAAAKVAAEAAAIAPRRTGRLAASYRPFVTLRGAGIRSRLPYAGVIEYGGTIRPKGTPISIRRYAPITTAIERRTNELVDLVGDAVEHAAEATGWRK